MMKTHSRRFGLSTSSVCWNERATHGKRKHEIQQSKQRRAATYENHSFCACMHVIRARNTVCLRKLKLMFNPLGLIVPSLKISFISCCLWLMLLPVHCLRPQTMMSSREQESELKCSATGNPREILHLKSCKACFSSCGRLGMVSYCGSKTLDISSCTPQMPRRLPLILDHFPADGLAARRTST